MFAESQVNENLISTGFNWTLDSANSIYLSDTYMSLHELNHVKYKLDVCMQVQWNISA